MRHDLVELRKQRVPAPFGLLTGSAAFCRQVAKARMKVLAEELAASTDANVSRRLRIDQARVGLTHTSRLMAAI